MTAQRGDGLGLWRSEKDGAAGIEGVVMDLSGNLEARLKGRGDSNGSPDDRSDD